MSHTLIQMPSNSLEYVKLRLSWGNRIIGILNDSIDVESGTFITFLPDVFLDIPFSDYESGAYKMAEINGFPNVQCHAPSICRFIKTVGEYIIAAKENLVVFECRSQCMNDPGVLAFPGARLEHSGELNYYVNQHNNVPQYIDDLIDLTISSMFRVILFSSLPEANLFLGHIAIDDSIAKQIAKNTVGIAMSSFDDEVFGYWIKKGHEKQIFGSEDISLQH